MNKWHKVLLATYLGVTTGLVIKSQLEIRWLTQTMSSLLNYLDQQQYDEAFAIIVEEELGDLE